MTTKKDSKKTKLPPPHTTAACSAKTAMTRRKDVDEEATAWLWCAAAAAWHAADPDRGEGCSAWGDEESAAEVARFFYHRARRGPAVVDDLRKSFKSTGGAHLEKPTKFKTWAKLAASLFAELGVNTDVDLVVGELRQWSVYHLEICRTEGDPLYDPRGELPPQPTLVAGIGAYGGVHDPIKVVPRKRSVVVSDGRQRTNATRQHNETSLCAYYERLVVLLRYREPQRSLLEVGKVEDIPPPALIRTVPIVVHPLERGRMLKSISNTHRLAESMMDEARAIWDLEDELKEKKRQSGDKAKGSDGWVVGQIAGLRGCSDQNVYNLLSLRKLSDYWATLLSQKKITGKTAIRLARETKTRQSECMRDLSKAHARSGYDPRFKRDKFVEAWLVGATTDAPAVVQVSPRLKTRLYEGAQRLRNFLEAQASEGTGQLLDVLHALGDGEAAEAARGRLPPDWRIAILGQTWREQDDVAAWKAIGVTEPATVLDLEHACAFTWALVTPEGAHGGQVDTKRLLEFAGRTLPAHRYGPQPLTGDGPPAHTIGAAYERRVITIDDVEEMLDDEPKTDGYRDDDEDANEGGRVPAVRDATDAGAESAAEQPDEDDTLREQVQESAATLNVKRPRKRKQQLALPATQPERPVKKWIGFTNESRDAWRAAGVESHVDAITLRGLGVTPELLNSPDPESASGLASFGRRFFTKAISVDDLVRRLPRPGNPTELESGGAP